MTEGVIPAHREPMAGRRRPTGMRAPAVLLVLALATAGCGVTVKAESGAAPVAGSPTSSPAATATPTPAAKPTGAKATPTPVTVTLTIGTRPASVHLGVGQQLLVRPAPGRPGKAFSVQAPPNSPVLHSNGGNTTTGWRFTAAAPGTVRLLLVYGPQCLQGELCPMFRGLLSSLTVTVG